LKIFRFGGISVEVKSTTNLQSKSLSHFVNKHSIQRAVKLSLLKERHNEVIFNEPLYLAEQLKGLVAPE
jgi:hypothetical protein